MFARLLGLSSRRRNTKLGFSLTAVVVAAVCDTLIHLAVSHHDVYLETRRTLLDGHIAWEAIDRTTGISGLLPVDDLLAHQSAKALKGVTPSESHHRWRGTPLTIDLGLVRPVEVLKIGGVCWARRKR